MQPFTPLLTRVCSSVNFYMQASLSWIDTIAGVRALGLFGDKFDAVHGKYLTRYPKDPGQSIHDLAADNYQKLIAAILANHHRTKDGSFTDFLEGEDYHFYFHGSKAVKVPEPFRPVFLNAKSWLAFRGMLKLFAPYGGEVPEVSWLGSGATDSFLGETTYSLLRDRQLEIAKYQHERLTADLAPTGLITLGHNFVDCQKATIIETDTHIIRVAEMNALLDWHILRGPAFWAQVYDKSDHTVSFQAVGAGKNSLPGVDKANNHLAGLVFGTMHETYGYVMEEAAKTLKDVRPLTEGTGDLLGPLLRSLARQRPDLAKRRSLAAALDSFSQTGMLLRGGMESVFGPDSLEIGICADNNKKD